jgi:hypothetical protein
MSAAVSDGLKKGIEKTQEFKSDLASSTSSLKNLADTYMRKEIKFNFLENITRWIYTHPSHLAKLEFIQYLLLIGLLYFYNPFEINTKYPVFSKLLILIIAFTYVILFIFIKMKVEAAEDVDLISPTETTILMQFIVVLVSFFFFMLAIKGVFWLLLNTKLMKLFHNMMTLFIIIGVLGIVYLVAKKTINKAKNAQGKSFLKLVLKIVMYLPCLLADIAEYIKYEFNLTTKPVWILCGIEAGFVGLWILLPFLFDKIVNLSGVKLLNEPVNLNMEMTIGNFNTTSNPNDEAKSIDQQYSDMVNAKAKADIEAEDDTKQEYTDPNVPKNKYLAWIYNGIKNFTWLKIEFKNYPQYTDYNTARFSYKYAISGWFYINPQPPNTSTAYSVYTNILNYGEKVKIEYNGKLSSLRVMAAVANTANDAEKNMMTEVYQTNEVIYQKWNNIVINYADGYMDVFLNGVLVGSLPGVLPYMSFDTIVVGARDGIIGGMCNVNYYKDVLNEKTIRLNYKTLRGKEYPYVGTLVNMNYEIKKNTDTNRFTDMFKNAVGA